MSTALPIILPEMPPLVGQEYSHAKVEALRAAMEKEFAGQLKYGDESAPPRHHMLPGVYVRDVVIEAGQLVIACVHRYEHLFAMIAGQAYIYSENFRGLMEAGYVSVDPAGTQRVVYAVTRCQFLTVHPNPDDIELDPVKLREHYACDNYEQFERELLK